MAGGKPGHVRIGVSGWVYPPWRGVFYPKKMAQRLELAHMGKTFPVNEINGTFYGTMSPDSFAKWRVAVPDDFVFAMKGPRFITHILRLRDAKQPLANFLASGPLCLGPKLGPLLWQLPPSFKFDAARIESFLTLLPHDTEAAATLAKTHDSRIKKAWVKTDKKRPLRHAMEIRHDSFKDPAFIKLLRKYKVALVCADTEEWPRLMDLTADFVYCRLHGAGELYFSNYDSKALTEWSKRVAAWAKGDDPPGEHVLADKKQTKPKRDVFVFFDNTAKVHAPDNALKLDAKVKKILAR